MIYKCKITKIDNNKESSLHLFKSKSIKKMTDTWLNRYDYKEVKVINQITKEVIRKMTPASGVYTE